MQSVACCRRKSQAPVCGSERSSSFPRERVCCAALVVIGSCTMKGHCTGEKPLSFGARPWCGVPAAASTLRSRTLRGTRGRAIALAVSRQEAQHARLPRARAVPRWLWSAYTQ